MQMTKMQVVGFLVTLLFETRVRKKNHSAHAWRERDPSSSLRRYAGTSLIPQLRIRQMHLAARPTPNASRMQTLCRSVLGIVEVQSIRGIVSWSASGTAITSTSRKRQRHLYRSLRLHQFLHHLFLLLVTCGTRRDISTLCMGT